MTLAACYRVSLQSTLAPDWHGLSLRWWDCSGWFLSLVCMSYPGSCSKLALGPLFEQSVLHVSYCRGHLENKRPEVACMMPEEDDVPHMQFDHVIEWLATGVATFFLLRYLPLT